MSDGVAELHTIEAPTAMEKSPLEIQAEAFVDKYVPETADVRGFMESLNTEPLKVRECSRLLSKPTTYGYDDFHKWFETELRAYRIAEYIRHATYRPQEQPEEIA